MRVLATIRTVVEQIDIPIEILSTIRTIVEQIDMPVEIIGVKTEAGVQKWVLSSRGKTMAIK